MELRRYLRLIRQRLLLLLVCLIVGVAVGYETTPKASVYKATATVYIGSRQLTDPQQLYATAGLDQIATTFAEMIPTPVIATTAVEATHVPRSASAVASSTTATVRTGTTLIDVSVTDADPVIAEALSNGIVNAFTNKVRTYDAATNGPGTLPTEPAYVFQPASLPTTPLPTAGRTHAIVGGIFGLVIGLLAVLLLDYLDLTIKSPDDLERRIDLPVLGIIPFSQELAQPNTPAMPRRKLMTKVDVD